MGVDLDQLPLSGVSPSVLLVAYLTIGLAVARLALGVFLLARGLPTRSRPVLRVCVVIACLVVGTSLFFAPLVLLPVRLVRNERTSTFDIQGTDDDFADIKFLKFF